jgi:catabolite repression protein CreC
MGPYGAGGIHPVPMIETNNTLSNPTGPEWQFLVGEGRQSHSIPLWYFDLRC